MNIRYAVAAVASTIALVGLVEVEMASAAPHTCSVMFSVGPSEAMGALQFNVDYGAVQGTFVRPTNGPSCKSAVRGGHVFTQLSCEGEYAACQWGEGRRLNVAVMFDDEVQGPSDVVTCEFLADVEPAIDAFSIRLDGAGAPETGSGLRQFPPTVSARSIDCK